MSLGIRRIVSRIRDLIAEAKEGENATELPAEVVGIYLSTKDLAKRAEVAERTAQAVLAALAQACVILKTDRTRSGRLYIIGYKVGDEWFVPLEEVFEQARRISTLNSITHVGRQVEHLSELDIELTLLNRSLDLPQFWTHLRPFHTLVCERVATTAKTLNRPTSEVQWKMADSMKPVLHQLQEKIPKIGVKTRKRFRLSPKVTKIEKSLIHIDFLFSNARLVKGVSVTVGISETSPNGPLARGQRYKSQKTQVGIVTRRPALQREMRRPWASKLAYWANPQAMLNAYADALRRVFPHRCFTESYFVAETCPPRFLEVMRSLGQQWRDFSDEYKVPIKPFEVFIQILALYKFIRVRRAPPAFWLYTEEFLDYAAQILESYKLRVWEDWAKYYGTWEKESEDFERWIGWCRDVAIEFGIPDPLEAGGVNLMQYARWCLFKAMNSFYEVEPKYRDQTGLYMAAYDYLKANFAYMARSSRFTRLHQPTLDFLFGPRARLRAWIHTVATEDRLYADPNADTTKRPTVH